jgi:hypothetical protein
MEMEIACTGFRPMEKNTLKGFATLVYSGLVIKDCPCHLKDGKKWIGFPSRSFQGNDGATKWQNLIEFDPSFDRNAWQDKATAAVDRFVNEQRAA